MFEGWVLLSDSQVAIFKGHQFFLVSLYDKVQKLVDLPQKIHVFKYLTVTGNEPRLITFGYRSGEVDKKKIVKQYDSKVPTGKNDRRVCKKPNLITTLKFDQEL